MWKRALGRGAVSYCVCVAVSNVVTLIMGLCGAQAACVPEFAARVGSPVTAAALQPLLIGMIGFAFGAGADARGAGIAPLYTVCSSLSMRAHSVGTSSHSSGRQSRIRHNSAAMRGLGCDAIAPSVCWML